MFGSLPLINSISIWFWIILKFGKIRGMGFLKRQIDTKYKSKYNYLENRIGLDY